MKKNEKLFDAFTDIDESFISEAAPNPVVVKKVRNPVFRRTVALVACLSIIVGAFAFWRVFSAKNPLFKYRNDEYYNVISALYAYYPKKDTNNTGKAEAAPPVFDAESDGASNATNGESYFETTDNQVNGVIEADLFKRSDKHIYYLYRNTVYVYSIAGEDSELLHTVKLAMPDNCAYERENSEMYLSADAKSLTVIVKYVNKDKESEIALITLALENGEPRQVRTVTAKGSYISSRLVDDEIILISSFKPVKGKIDYDDPETFVPSVNSGEGYECIDADDIVTPKKLTNDRYTVVTMYDGASGSLLSSCAFLSYTGTVFVSEDAIYTTSAYIEYSIDKDYVNFTDVTRVDYKNGALEIGRTYRVKGRIENQYSLDEYKGALRIVTSTDERKAGKTVRSASLFCIDIESGKMLGTVENFAPEGEEVTAARFDGDALYVCTAEIVTFTDPVFFFDLSDMTNITYTDTGYIDGFSSSLINMGEGLLLGIGSESWSSAKVELYTEADGEVISLDKYLIQGNVSSDYKSYYVNREENLFGFGAYVILGTPEKYDQYTYFVFDVSEGRLDIALEIEGWCDVKYKRACLIDGYFYIIGCTKFAVVEYK